jgi:hypothetical protein
VDRGLREEPARQRNVEHPGHGQRGQRGGGEVPGAPRERRVRTVGRRQGDREEEGRDEGQGRRLGEGGDPAARAGGEASPQTLEAAGVQPGGQRQRDGGQRRELQVHRARLVQHGAAQAAHGRGRQPGPRGAAGPLAAGVEARHEQDDPRRLGRVHRGQRPRDLPDEERR